MKYCLKHNLKNLQIIDFFYKKKKFFFFLTIRFMNLVIYYFLNIICGQTEKLTVYVWQ